MKRIVIVLVLVASMLGLAGPATAGHNQDQHSDNMSLVSATPNATGATNSDLALWVIAPMPATTTGSGSSTSPIPPAPSC